MTTHRYGGLRFRWRRRRRSSSSTSSSSSSPQPSVGFQMFGTNVLLTMMVMIILSFVGSIGLFEVLPPTLQVVEAVRRMPGDILHQHYPLREQQQDQQQQDQQQQEHQDYSRRRLLEYMDMMITNTTTTTNAKATTNRGRSTIAKIVDVPKPTSPNDHLVDNTKLPLFEHNAVDGTDFVHWAGLLPASSDNTKYFFYWLFAPDTHELEQSMADDRSVQDNTDIPLVIWLNGGPACSSMDGLWLENGPLRLVRKSEDSSNNEYEIKVSPYSWHKAPAYVLYIDQPVGTGLSFTTAAKYPTNDEQVNVDFYYFLQQFFTLHSDKFLKPMDDKNNNGRQTLSHPFYFSGESHAGHYIPSMMNYIRKQNENAQQTSNIDMPLSGAAIGNGWVDPIYQYSAQDAAYGNGLVGLAQKRHLYQEELQCRKLLKQNKYTNSICFGLLDQVIDNSQGTESQYVVSMYDNRKWEMKNKPRDFPPGHTQVEHYLGGHGPSVFGSTGYTFQDVLQSIHATPSLEAGQSFRECTDPPYNALKHQDGLGVVPDVIDLLNVRTIRMLFFNGIHDLICNHVGNEEAIENFQWQYQYEYQQSGRYGWKSHSTGQLGGYMKEFNNLMYLKVLDSGHMVPMDVPDVSLDMLRTFIFNKSFKTFRQEITGVKQKPNQSNDDSADGKGGSTTECPVCEKCDHNDGNNDSSATKEPVVQCPVCDDCDNICKLKQQQEQQQQEDKEDVPSSSLNLSTKSDGIVWGIIMFATLSAMSCIVWMFCCRGGRRSGRNTRNGYDRQQQYDMEMSKTSSPNGNGHHGGFRDDSYLDEYDEGME